MYNGRLFAFGCSFTRYNWPTWADLLGQEFEGYYNYGRAGAGNLFISCMLGEAIARYNINKNDTVMIMWSNVTREDRYVEEWVNPGNIFTQTTYPEDFVKNFITVRGCYIRDLALINLTHNLLKNLGCKYEFMSMIDMNSFHQWDFNDDSKEMQDVFDLYKDTLAICKPSVFKVIFNYDWYKSRPLYTDPNKLRADIHPLPSEHIEYINKVLPNYQFSEDTLRIAMKEDEKVRKVFAAGKDTYPIDNWWVDEFKNKDLMRRF